MRILTLTENSNVDFEKRIVINESKIFTKQFNDHDVVTIFDKKENATVKTDIAYISLYENKLIIDDIQYCILHMLSK